MNKKRSNYIIYSLIILVISFYAFLTGCRGSASNDVVIINSPSAIISGDTPVTPQSKNIPITNDGKVYRNSSPSGMMTIEAPEGNSFNSNVVLRITESPSVGNESNLLSVGSTIYAITATRDEVPINILNHPMNLTFSNEQRLSGAESYYIGIKDINGGDWQFVNVYTTNATLRPALTSKNEFSYSLYKCNVLVALFADAKNTLRSTPKVFDIMSGLSPIDVSIKDSLYKDDLKVSLVLNGENLSGLNANNFKIKVGFLTSENKNPSLKVDNQLVSYLSGKGSNPYEAFGEGYAHYFQFTPSNTKFTSGFSASLYFDINLTDIAEKDFSNNFIVEISNADSNILPFAYSALMKFSKSDSNRDTDTENNTDTDTNTDSDTDTSTETDTNTGTSTGSSTGSSTDTGTETEIVEKAVISLKSPTTDFPVTNSTIELEFSKEVPWIQIDKDKIAIDNGAEISNCSYNNKILTLTLKNRLNYSSSYTIRVSNLSYAADNTFTITTEGKATVSLKSVSSDFPVKDRPIELEFSKDIPWSVQYAEHISIDNGVNITSYQYNNKVLTLGFSGKLNYSKTYKVSVADFETVVNNDDLTFTTQSLEVTAVISSTTQNVAPNSEGLLTILQPKFFVNFGKEIANSALAKGSIKLNGSALPQSCRITFDAASQTATIQFTENLEYFTEYDLSVLGYTDDDGGVINSTTSPLTFKTQQFTDISGSGTEEDPFLVYTEAHLRKLNQLSPVNYMNGGFYFKQMEDIVLTASWTPITLFIGNYNGNNKFISSISFNDEEKNDIGLFGITKNSTISSLTIKNVNLNGYKEVGSLVGFSQNSVFENINVNDEVVLYAYNGYVGGLVGKAENCDFRKVTINGDIKITSESSYTGGLIGYLHNPNTVTNCFVISNNMSFIKGGYDVGGLIGCSYGDINIEKSYAKSLTIQGTYYVGGFIGALGGDNVISNCYCDFETINITENYTSYIGGFIGSNDNYINLSNSYASGSIFLNSPRGTDRVGVIAGSIGSTDEYKLNNNFSRVKITVGDSYESSYSSVNNYKPTNPNIPIWNEDYSRDVFNASGTNYVSDGYKESLNWDSNVWDNLTEGALPTLKK